MTVRFCRSRFEDQSDDQRTDKRGGETYLIEAVAAVAPRLAVLLADASGGDARTGPLDTAVLRRDAVAARHRRPRRTLLHPYACIHPSICTG